MDLWGLGSYRRTFGDKHWHEPLKWEKRAAKEGRRLRVFCASMADVFDNEPGLDHHRLRLWQLIRATPHLDWLVLTKRIGNARTMLPADWGDGYPNVQLGASIVNQPEADRDVVKLLSTPARIHFVSAEPLLGPINFGLDLGVPLADGTIWTGSKPRIDWVICGGESGHKARPMEVEWARSLRTQCARTGVAFFMKQLSQHGRSWFKDFEAFPPDLQVREWPTITEVPL